MSDQALPRETSERQEAITGLRALADFLDAHPDAKLPHNVQAMECHDSAEALADRVRALGGHWDKTTDGSYLELNRSFGPRVTYQLFAARAKVCERIVTGTEEVEVKEYPAVEPIVRTETREVVEWRCPPILDSSTASVT
jgi:hypothetical protein